MNEVFVGRQPIFNAKKEVLGYELLFRGFPDKNVAEIIDGDKATSQVILNAFMEIGLEKLVGPHKAFINLTRSFVTGKYPLPEFPEQLVLEVLEDIEVDDEIENAVKDLKSRGYTIALDDVISLRGLERLLKYVDIVKIDLMAINRDHLPVIIEKLKLYNITILAEKVENAEEFELCEKLGCTMFQGFFLSKPEIVKEKKLPQANVGMLRLLSELQSANIKFDRLEEIIRKDLTLSYKLLKLINSAFYARASKIQSVRQALTLLGLRKVQSWLSMLFLTSIDEKPSELMLNATVRARMSEQIARETSSVDPETAFTIGLFSVLDAMLDKSFEEILEPLQMVDEIKFALVERAGKFGELLTCVIAYEEGDWDNVTFDSATPELIRDTYLEAIEWSKQVSSAIKS